MFRFELSGEFPATHRIRIDTSGTLEPLHAHNWRIRACLRAPHDDDDLRADAEALLDEWIARHEGRCFNDLPPFDTVNPTAEEVARVLTRHFEKELPSVTVERVEVGEAAGFSATYWPDGPSPGPAADPAASG